MKIAAMRCSGELHLQPEPETRHLYETLRARRTTSQSRERPGSDPAERRRHGSGRGAGGVEAHAAADPLCQIGRDQHRLSGDRRWADRHDLCAWMGLQSRPCLGLAAAFACAPAPRHLLPPDPHGQARHGAVRPQCRFADAGRADGRRAGGAGCGRLEAHGPVRQFRGRPNVHAVRGDLSRAHGGTRAQRGLCQGQMVEGLPLGEDKRAGGRRSGRHRATSGGSRRT